MKKVLVLTLAFVVCILPATSFAASIGNRAEPIGNLKFAVGAEGNFMFERDMEARGTSTSGSTVTGFTIKDMNQEYAKLILGLTDYINIFAKLGASRIGDARLQFSTGEDVKAKFKNEFLSGGGVNAAYKFGADKNFLVGLNAGFTYFKPNVAKFDVSGSSVTNASGKIKIKEWQVGGYAGMKLNLNDNLSLLPYLGVFYNNFNTKTGGIDYTIAGTEYNLTIDSDAEDETGVAVGVDVGLFKNFTLNVEGRFIAGNSVTVGGTWKF